MAEYFFDSMTIGQLREMTEQYKKLQAENKILRTKYPNKAKDMDNSLRDILKEVGVDVS